MKPTSQFGTRKFPQTDCFFQSGHGRWQGFWSSSDGDDRWEFRNRYNLGREYLIEAAREWKKEAIVFAMVVLASAWPVIYMVVSVIQLLIKGHPLQ